MAVTSATDRKFRGTFSCRVFLSCRSGSVRHLQGVGLADAVRHRTHVGALRAHINPHRLIGAVPVVSSAILVVFLVDAVDEFVVSIKPLEALDGQGDRCFRAVSHGHDGRIWQLVEEPGREHRAGLCVPAGNGRPPAAQDDLARIGGTATVLAGDLPVDVQGPAHDVFEVRRVKPARGVPLTVNHDGGEVEGRLRLRAPARRLPPQPYGTGTERVEDKVIEGPPASLRSPAERYARP